MNFKINETIIKKAFNILNNRFIVHGNYIDMLIFMLYYESGLSYRDISKILLVTNGKRDKVNIVSQQGYISFQKLCNIVDKVLEQLVLEYNNMCDEDEKITKKDITLYFLYVKNEEILINKSRSDVYTISIDILDKENNNGGIRNE